MLIINSAKLYNPGKEERLVSIIIDNGKIIDIKDPIKNSSCEDVIDVCGSYVTPGLIETSCSIGIKEQIYRFEGDDANETTNPVQPELRALDGINPIDEGFKMAIESGVTTVVTGPGDANVIGGTFVAMKTAGDTLDQMVIEPEIAMKFVFGNSPKEVYGSKDILPTTRMGVAYLIRDALERAKEYKRLNDIAIEKSDITLKPKFDIKLEALSKVFEGMQVKVTAHQDYDIDIAIRICREYDLNFVIDRCTEGYRIPKSLKNLNIICLGPGYGGKRKHDIRNRDSYSGSVFERENISFCLSTGHPEINIDMNVLQAIMMIDKGLSKETAFKSLTINGAKCIGLEDRIGSIEVGKDADLVVWSGDPFDYYTFVDRVIVDGMERYNRKLDNKFI